MQTIQSLGAAAIMLALANCAPASEQAPEAGNPSKPEATTLGEATLVNADGTEVGTAVLSQNNDEVSVALVVDGVEPGEHAFHLHTTGACEAPDFTSAGGHLNPFDKSHGSMSENGKHLGDLPNITVTEGEPLTQTFALEGDAEVVKAAIFDEDGTAVMIHAGPDDYVSDPAGAAGPRVACGVVNPSS
ncbi:superoxide dismutase family protein [Erythrobacter sp. GH1-10]|uniref:superoxide dismutase family protein n=1 Tax=Erythrobacter sp. GH1-10 TaxID=3349334 RepID=UPI00387835A9